MTRGAARLPDLSLTEWAVLALVRERPAHGFAIAKEFAPDSDLGRVWTIPRPIVYRALARLEAVDLIEPLVAEPGERGPTRTRFRTTRSGTTAVDLWLQMPAVHVRDLRTRLLLQFRLLDRRGVDIVPLARAQLERLEPIVAALDTQAQTSGFDGLLARWRYETARAAARVLERIVSGDANLSGDR